MTTLMTEIRRALATLHRNQSDGIAVAAALLVLLVVRMILRDGRRRSRGSKRPRSTIARKGSHAPRATTSGDLPKVDRGTVPAPLPSLPLPVPPRTAPLEPRADAEAEAGAADDVYVWR
jgi:hypothetical protein